MPDAQEVNRHILRYYPQTEWVWEVRFGVWFQDFHYLEITFPGEYAFQLLSKDLVTEMQIHHYMIKFCSFDCP